MLKKLVTIGTCALAACSSSAQFTAVPRSNPQRTLQQERAPQNARWLYVSDSPSRAILRFPLSNGIPAKQPDRTLTGLTDPAGIAIGPDRRLYVIDRATKSLVIYSIDSGAPVRTVSLKRRGLGAIAVDAAGYVYYGWENVCTTEGFYCGNVEVLSSFSSGLQHVNGIPLGGGGGSIQTAHVLGLAVNASHLLATDLAFTQTEVFANAPFVTSFFPLCGGVADAGTAWGPNNTLYVTDVNASAPQIVVTPNAVSPCPPYYTLTSATTRLLGPLQIAAGDGNIYVSSAYSKTAGSASIFVFNPSIPGSQTPLAIVQGKQSGLHAIAGLAVAR